MERKKKKKQDIKEKKKEKKKGHVQQFMFVKHRRQKPRKQHRERCHFKLCPAICDVMNKAGNVWQKYQMTHDPAFPGLHSLIKSERPEELKFEAREVLCLGLFVLFVLGIHIDKTKQTKPEDGNICILSMISGQLASSVA